MATIANSTPTPGGWVAAPLALRADMILGLSRRLPASTVRPGRLADAPCTGLLQLPRGMLGR